MAPTKHPVHPDVLTLAQLYAAEWPAARQRIRASGHPTCEDPADPPADPVDPPADPVDPPADPPKDPPADPVKPDDDWKSKSRKNETRAKKAEQERDELKARLAKIEESNLSEQEKAIAKAREEAAGEVTTKYETKLRERDIEGAVTKLSLRGFKAKDGDGKDITLKFADPDDAQLRLDRALRNGEIDYADIYADGKVNTEAVTQFLTELLEEHPRLRAQDASSNGGTKKVDFDAGKGSGSGRRDLESMTPDDHLKEIQGRK